MFTVKLQSPTQGPLITIAFEDAENSNAPTALLVRGVPGGAQWLSEIANGTRPPTALPPSAGLFTSIAPYILPLLCSGDTSQRLVASPDKISEAVSLADEVSPSVASELEQLIADLEKQIASSSIFHPGQKVFLTQVLERVRAGHLGADRLLEHIWKMLTDDLLNRSELLGAEVRTVVKDELCYLRIQYDTSNAPLEKLLTPLLHVLLFLQLKIPNHSRLVENAASDVVLFLPTWKTMQDLYQHHVMDIVWVARQLNTDENIAYWDAKRVPIRIAAERLAEWLHELGVSVHPVIFMMYEFYHALSTAKLSSEKEVVLGMLQGLVTRDSQYADELLARVIALAGRMSTELGDHQRLDALWELLELDLALRAMKSGARVEVTDDVIRIVARVGNEAVEELMEDMLRVMQGMRRGEMKLLRVSGGKKARTFELMRWSKFNAILGAGNSLHWKDFVESLQECVASLKSIVIDGHPLASAWENVREAP